MQTIYSFYIIINQMVCVCVCVYVYVCVYKYYSVQLNQSWE